MPLKQRLRKRTDSPRKKRAVLSESDVQETIMTWLWLSGFVAWPNKTQGTFDPKRQTFRSKTKRYDINGVSDILGCLSDGRLLAIEVKRPYIKGKQTAGKLSEDQRNFIDRINKNGGLAFVAYSLDDVKLNLRDVIDDRK